ncbi:uncharacterized protein [Rutidosis leptorrhynchoides]|uniref:uncharacterized protein n=1 Tax=Rutidosis leptorrhynchoides TaxID=125765 RepID=UPI003A993E25
MPVVKLLTAGEPDAMSPQEGIDSLDTFIRQAVGKEPLFSFSRTGDNNPTQWIQLLHNFDQQDVTGWPLLAPVRVQMQKCDKCAREFCSTINYRRHIRKHRRTIKFHKEPQQYRDLLGAFWDKLSYSESKEITSFEDVNLEEVPGSSIVKNIAVNLRKTTFLSLPQVYVKAGSSLVDIVHGRLSRLPLSSEELFNVLDDASEGTFLCSGTAESVMKYVFDSEAMKIGLETKNLIACTSFLLEQKLVKAWLADKDAEALRCQKLLVEEEEAAQRRQAKIVERKRQRKIRKKEERARDRSNGLKVDLYTPNVSASIVSEDTSSSQISSEAVNLISDENFDAPLNNDQFSGNDDVIDIDHSDILPDEKQKTLGSGWHRFVGRWQVPKSQRGSRNGFRSNQNGKKMIKREHAHKHKEQRVGYGKIWTKKTKFDNDVKSRVHDDAINQTSENNCQLMIGSISVTLRNSTAQNQVNGLAKFQDNDSVCGPQHDTRVRLTDSEDTNSFNVQAEDKQETIPFSIDAAKAFLSQRWKEAISEDHVDLVLTSAPEPPDVQADHQAATESAQQHVVVCDGGSRAGTKYRTKPEKSIKTKYIRKQRDVN